ncbi:MAG: hypothetical protein KDF59_16230 [Nitrosomonas sp.]|nr:hypothetical protein [Nitrosomonas sp.]
MKIRPSPIKLKLAHASFFISVLFSSPGQVYAQNQTNTLLTFENQQRIEQAVRNWAINPQMLLDTFLWFQDLTRDSQESSAYAELSRLKFMHAQLEENRPLRLQLFRESMSIADQALALNTSNSRALFWKAVAMGKIVEDGGILSALKMLRPMEQILLRVIELDELYENAGAHRALGRMYHLLPSFPIGFGNKQKAYTHLTRAHELFPNDLITRAFYADLLFDIGKKKDARMHADFVLATPVDEANAREFAEYITIAQKIVYKTGRTLAQHDSLMITEMNR